jgi:multiple sugar transport system permease protein
MAPTLWLILLLRLVEAFKIFDIPTSLTLGGPGRATEVYSLFTYRTALRFFDHGYAAAQGFLLLVIVSLIVSLLFSRIRELYEEGR